MKNIFIKSTIILMIGTMITKLLSFVIRIILARTLKENISLYAIVLPTEQLLLTITSLGLPYSISVIMAKNKYKTVHIFSSIIPITIIFNIFIITLTILLAPVISNYLLKNPDTYFPIISIVFILPFTSLSGIIKGYYFGKQKTLPNSISSIFEQLTRLLILLLIIPFLIKKNPIIAISVYIGASAICEIVQIIIYLFFLPKHISISLSDLKIQPYISSEILKLSIPTVSRTIIGNICYFLEPIILTNILLIIGYSNQYILEQYGIYNTYVIPILSAPSFIIMALNTTLIPEVSKNSNNKYHIKKRLKQCLFFSLLLGICYCIFVYIFASQILKIVFATKKGITYIKILAITFPIFYIEGPMFATLIGLGLTKQSMKITLISCIVKLLTITFLSLLSIGIYGLIISEIINILLVIYLCYLKLHKLKYI